MIGKNYLEKKRLAAWLTPIIVYVFIRFTDVILNTYAPALVAKIVYMVVLAFSCRRTCVDGKKLVSIRETSKKLRFKISEIITIQDFSTYQFAFRTLRVLYRL